MNSSSKLLLFDYDGTIVNSELAILNGIKYALNYFNCSIPTDEVLRKNIGKPLLPLFSEYTGNPDPSFHNKLLETYRSWYMDASLKEEINDHLYPNAYDVINDLFNDGYLLGIATNKSRSGLLEGLERHKLLKFFSCLKTVHDTKPKPEPDMGLEIISEMKVIKTNVLMIGDTINDALMSKNCNIKFIGVNWGFNDKETLMKNGAIDVVETYHDLYKKIKTVLP